MSILTGWGALPLFAPKPTPEEKHDPNINDDIKCQYRTNDLVASLINSNIRGVVGVRLNIRSDTEDDNYNTLIDSLLKKWSRKGNCEITGRFHFGLAQRLIQANIKAYGGIIIRHYLSPDFKYGYKFELIDVAKINTDYNKQGFINGIKTDKFGQIAKIRLFVNKYNTKEKTISMENATYVSIPWDDIHRYSPFSTLNPALKSIKFMNEYSDTQLKAEKQKARRGAIIGSKFYASLVDYYTQIIEKAKRGFRNGNINKKDVEEAKSRIDGLRLQSLDDVQYIPHGDEVHNMNIMNNINFKEMANETKKVIASADGNNAMDAFNDSPSSYNAALLGQNKAEATYEMDADNLFELALRDIVENAVRGFKIKGFIKAKDFYRNEDKYINLTYDRKTTAHIDPVKTEKAVNVAIENGTTTLIDENSKRGQDWKKQLEKQMRYKMEKKRLKKKLKSEMKNEI